MAPVTIELKIISGTDLKAFNFFQKLNIYATALLVTEKHGSKTQSSRHQQHKTPVDKEGDGNPEWNHVIRFDLKQIVSSSSDLDHTFLKFHLISEAVLFANKTIGEVRVPLKDLIEESNGPVRYTTYQVKNRDGNPNGMLNFSYKVVDDHNDGENKIGNGFYPVINRFDFPAISMSSSYSPPESNNQSTPAASFYQPPPESYYPAPVYPPPPPMAHEMEYYPPPPPPPPMGYHGGPPPPPPPPYGYDGYGGYDYPRSGYPTTVEHLHHQCDEDTWQKGDEFRNSWNVR